MAIGSFKTTRDIARVWFYWKIPALITFSLIVFVICLYSFTQTPIYESRAKLLLLPSTSTELVVSPGDNSRQYLASSVRDSDIENEMQFLRSAEVYKNTLAHLEQSFRKVESEDGEKKTAHSLLGELSFSPAARSNIIEVSLGSPYKEYVADVLSIFLNNYFDYRKKTYSVGDTESFYDKQRQYYILKLEEALSKLNDFKQKWNIVNIEAETSANLDLLSKFQVDLETLNILIAENKAKIDMLQEGFKIKDDEILLSREMRKMPVIQQLASGLVPLLIKRIEISKTYTKESREYRMIDEQIDMLRQEIQKEGIGATRSDLLENDILIIRRDQIQKKIEELRQASKNLQRRKDTYDSLNVDVQVAKDNLLKYGEKKEDSRLFSERDEQNLVNVVFVEEPTSPGKPKSPNKMLAFQVSVVFGLFAALILPFVLETLDHKIKTVEDVERVMALPVVCTYNEQ